MPLAFAGRSGYIDKQKLTGTSQQIQWLVVVYVSVFRRAVSESRFFARLRKSRTLVLFVCLVIFTDKI